MIPRWLYTLIAENRSRSEMSRDEHSAPIEEQSPKTDIESHRAFPGYISFYSTFRENALQEYKPKKEL